MQIVITPHFEWHVHHTARSFSYGNILLEWMETRKMSKFEGHCNESIKLFGKPYEEVHLWLDEFHSNELYKMRHQRVRLHGAGIREVIKLFGQEAGAVAKQHIVSDLKEEGWKKGDPFPRDEVHYVKMGLF